MRGLAMRWFDEVCQAAEYVHSRGVVHRGIRPDRIFLTGGGAAKLGGLGIERDDGGGTGGADLYSAPELLRGAEHNNRVDVWSLGCVLHEMAAGSPAFRCAGDIAALRFPHDTPSYAAAIVMIALSASPRARLDMPALRRLAGDATKQEARGARDWDRPVYPPPALAAAVAKRRAAAGGGPRRRAAGRDPGGDPARLFGSPVGKAPQDWSSVGPAAAEASATAAAAPSAAAASVYTSSPTHGALAAPPPHGEAHALPDPTARYAD